MFDDQLQDFDGYSIIGDIAYPNELDGRKAIADPSYKWSGGIVPYKFYKSRPIYK